MLRQTSGGLSLRHRMARAERDARRLREQLQIAHTAIAGLARRLAAVERGLEQVDPNLGGRDVGVG
jgi:hypothetical protein